LCERLGFRNVGRTEHDACDKALPAVGSNLRHQFIDHDIFDSVDEPARDLVGNVLVWIVLWDDISFGGTGRVYEQQ
jgi:hypothetical protein